MKKAFITLYFLIVFVILVGGWILDSAWENFHTSPQASQPSELVLDILSQSLKGFPLDEAKSEAARLTAHLNLDLQIYQLEDFTGSSITEKINRGIAVTSSSASGTMTMYKKIPNSDIFLAISYLKNEQNPLLYYVFLGAFYLLVGAAIYLWIWPLFRDLSNLEKHTSKLGKKSSFPTVSLAHGSHIGFLETAFNDMSKRIKALLRQRKEMTYAVSHELRTPLARIKFLLELAKKRDNISDTKQDLSDIERDIHYLENFVTHFLGYANFDQSEESLHKETGELVTFCQSVVDNIPSGSTSISLSTSDPSIIISADWQLLERALSNLLENALKHCHTKIFVHLKSREASTEIIVEDDGSGISLDESERIFEAFVQGKHSEANSGYGLGLAIVKRIAHWHGGTLSAHNHAESGGAVFTLTLASKPR